MPADEDVLELDEPLGPPGHLGPPLLDEDAAGHSREALEGLQTSPRLFPPRRPSIRSKTWSASLLRPTLKQWLDEHLPQMVDEHVKREISRITGKPL